MFGCFMVAGKAVFRPLQPEAPAAISASKLVCAANNDRFLAVFWLFLVSSMPNSLCIAVRNPPLRMPTLRIPRGLNLYLPRTSHSITGNFLWASTLHIGGKPSFISAFPLNLETQYRYFH
jgi:hypothetical protein